MVPLQIVTVIAGILYSVLKVLFPNLPLTTDQIVFVIVTLLGLFGVVVQLRNQSAIRKFDPNGGNVILTSKAFWIMVAGLVSFVLTSYFPDFPVATVDIAGLLLWVLAQFGINPQLRSQGLLK